jgi:hypothetical protein
MFTADKSILAWIPKYLLLWMVEDRNLLVKLLLGANVSNKEIEKYEPKTEWRWSGRENGDSNYRKLEGEEANGNLLDKDILLAVKNHKK